MFCGFCVVGLVLLALIVIIAFLLEIRSIESVKRVLTNLKNGQKWQTAVYSVDEQSTNHGGMLAAKVLKSHGVETIFTLVGGHISPILVACEKLGIRVVDTRHEVTTVFAADATARLKQSIGVAAVTAGPGVTNTITAMKNAQMAESPILLLGGAAATLLKGRGALQDIDQISLFRPICKLCISVTRVRDIVPLMKYAIQTAMSGTPGPVFIEFPIDTLYPYTTVYRELGVNPNARTMQQKFVNHYLQWHVSRMFANAWIEQDATPLHVDVPKGTNEQLQAACELIAKAQRPLMLIGSQALLPPLKADALAKAVEALGIPAYLGGMARGLLGRQHRLQMRQKRREALKDADVVILAGAVCDFRLSYGRVLSRQCKIIAINRDKVQLTKNSDMFWRASVSVQSDVGTFVQSMCEQMQQRGHKGAPSAWVDTLRKRDDEADEGNVKMSLAYPPEHLNPVAVCMALEDALPDNAILVADGGDFVGTAAYTIRPRGPLQWLDPGAFGTLGVGGGFALGAKLACPDRPVVIIYGDGSLGYSLMEYDTYKRHKCPIISIVGNDACWSQIAREQVPMFNSSVACDLEYTSYEQMVAPLDAKGVVIDKNASNAADGQRAEMAKQFRAMFSDYNTGKQSVLMNVLIGKSSFREGSISV